jgi:hypothetical protein
MGFDDAARDRKREAEAAAPFVECCRRGYGSTLEFVQRRFIANR